MELTCTQSTRCGVQCFNRSTNHSGEITKLKQQARKKGHVGGRLRAEVDKPPESLSRVKHQVRQTQVSIPMSKSIASLGGGVLRRLVTVLLAALVGPWTVVAADLTAAWELFLTGKYQECSTACQAAIDAGEFSENWRLLKIESDWTRGDYLAALETLDTALRRYSTSPRLRWLAVRITESAGLAERSKQLREELLNLVQQYPYVLSDAAARVAVGEFLLSEGADARYVLEQFFDRAKKTRPDAVEPYLAAGTLALQKHDYRVAAEEFQKALRISPEHPQALFGLVEAYAPSDAEQAQSYLRRTLDRNPRYLPALLWVAERHIDAERYDEAEAVLQQALEINPEMAEIWALRAVIAHLQSLHERENFYRQIALGWWPLNPNVDWLIGRKLSQHYRFAEGAEYQRRALHMDGRHLLAKFQLGQDLIRLGDPDGWQQMRAVAQSDPYNVVAHNLVLLADRLDTFTTLRTDTVTLRMDPKEAQVYGQQALQWLDSASKTLCEKYKVSFSRPIIVEIFPQQADFAIRTFGLPGGEGFLGVCFGPVITANSPTAQGAAPSNWKSVLWHEFCHSVTLEKTRNKMPRWFSEGISVYEETLVNPAWGESMTPLYRKWILEGQLTPIAKMNSAFLEPPSGLHLQFAYYQASLIIEFLIKEFGHDVLIRILDDLASGVVLNDSLERHTRPLETLEKDFIAYARRKAEQFCPDIDWEEPPLEVRQDRVRLDEWLRDHPNSYFTVRQRVTELMRNGQWDEARRILEPLRQRCREYRGEDSPAALLVTVYRQLGDRVSERAALEDVAAARDNALEVWERLIELARQADDWEAVLGYCQRALAVQPLRSTFQLAYAEAAERLQRDTDQMAAYRALLALEPSDPAELYYRLARAYQRRGRLAEARRSVLQALEEAPGFRAAQDLLWELTHDHSTPPATHPSATPENVPRP